MSSANGFPLGRPFARALLLTLVSVVMAMAGTPPLADTFPFDPCIRSQSQSRYRIAIASYTPGVAGGLGHVCLSLSVLPASQCSSKLRCCSANFDKLKMYASYSRCDRTIQSISIGGRQTDAVYWVGHAVACYCRVLGRSCRCMLLPCAG